MINFQREGVTCEELVVLSFPGAGRSIRMEDLQTGKAFSRRYRNRRIGEFPKELDLAEGRSTGVPKILRTMRQNGSPEPVFESDDDRTSFLVRLPAHQRANAEPAGQDTGQDTGQDNLMENKEKTTYTLQDTLQDTPQVTKHVLRLIASLTGEMNRAELQEALMLQDRSHFIAAYLEPAIGAGLIEMTLPDKPTSKNQRYRRTAKGEALAEQSKRTNDRT